MEKPAPRREEARWLEVHEAALLLESVRTYQPLTEPQRQAHGGAISANANPHIYPLLATFLLTGGGKSEVLGLEVDDVSFQRTRRRACRHLTTVPPWHVARELGHSSTDMVELVYGHRGQVRHRRRECLVPRRGLPGGAWRASRGTGGGLSGYLINDRIPGLLSPLSTPHPGTNEAPQSLKALRRFA